MKHILYAWLAAILLTACHEAKPKAVDISPKLQAAANDTTIYGLVCDGSNDTILVFLHDPYDGADPDTLNILDASKQQRVFGTLRIGDKLALLLDTADATKASLVIITEDLLGQWCYKVKPTLRRKAGMEGYSTAHAMALLPDSIQKLMEEEREYGFTLKIDSLVMPIGQRARVQTTDEESPIEYPTPKRYRQWYIQNGRLLLVEMSPDSLGNLIPTATDTAEIVVLTPDSLVLRFPEGEQGYYRKAETGE
ncbi:MAG: lipocalin family protein [Prevotella sp.]|nr:lipocalin family protein [Prevotella sp.]